MIPHSALSRCVKAVQGQFPLMVSLICIILAGFVYFLPDAFPAQVTLSWDPPTTNTDGTPLTDLSGYNVYYGTTSRSYSQTIDAGNTNSYTVSNLSDGTYYFAVTAYDVSRNESTYSNEVNKTIQSTPTYELTVNRTGDGIVTGSGINCGFDCAEPCTQGTVITLGASPNSGSSFTGWSGGGCSGTGQCVITMNATTTVTATFSSLNTPTVAAAASASPNPVTGTTTSLSVLGADDGGEANLTYTWATTGTPPAAVAFSTNGTNGAKNTTATFTRAGSYSLQVTIKDLGNLTVTSSVNVTVNQTLTTITVSPASASVNTGATQQFTASATDQFGTLLSPQPSFLWTMSGGGTISSSGLFTAGSAAGGPYTVTASSGGKSGTASVTVTAGGAILGNNVVGTSTDPSGGNDLKIWRFQAGSSFTAKNMQINLANGITGKMKVAIYADNNGSPGSLLIKSYEITNPSLGWVTFRLRRGQTITSGTYYWLAVWSNVGYTPRCQTTGGTARYITKTYGTWPNPLNGTQGPYTNKESIFAY